MMRIYSKIILLYIFASIGWTPNSFGQNWQKSTNIPYLKNLSVELEKTYQQYRQSAETYAFERHQQMRQVLDNGTTVSLIRIMPSGIPEYYKTHNLEASKNVGTIYLRPKEKLGLNLTGKNMLIGIWDSGSTNVEHQEFGDRVEIKDNIPFDDHGTHVAGTIAAAGINPQAKGMAYEAHLFAYEFNNDNAEMANEAANGLIISNHSYGLRTGWDVTSGGTGWQWFGDPSVSNVEDYRFGYYDASNSRVWDDIAFNAPYYLIIKSAGNDRTDVGDGTRPPDGPYDCLEPKSVAKNILTIGAVAHLAGDYTGPDDVIMSEFSSWGPTDDGRIKPDICAIGVDVYSTLSGAVDAYGTFSGTSMSAPNTTGSLALLQEYYARLHGGDYMRSATLKGLVIHTAREAGKNPGPDYEYGWGLLAVDKAANLITRNDGENYILKELTLQEGDNIVVNVSSDGTSPLTATISWTDVPGVPAAISLDPPDLMLINDLDMRIYDANGIEYIPWILDPSAPDKGATVGDNFRDNVEKIEITAPAVGDYTIVIKHKNTLKNKKQDFSLIVSNSSLNLSLTKFYWIGGSGDWNDVNHWSLSSGGNIANAIPGIANPVIFDNNSFTGTVNTINLTTQASCYNINYYSTDSCTINLSSFPLNMDGGIFDENSKLAFDNGKISFKGLVSKNNEILAAGGAFNNVDLEFNSTNGSWNFGNNFKARSLVAQNSSLYASNHNITVGIVNITAINDNVVNFSGSVIDGLESMNLNNSTNINFSGSDIKFSNSTGNASKSMTAQHILFNVVSVEQADLTITGDNLFNKIIANGNILLNGNNNIDSLRLSDVSSLTLQDGTTQTINSDFDAKGSVGNLIKIYSTGTNTANLFADNSNIRFCFDYLDIQNVSVSGSTGFLTGNNSQLSGNSTGWINLDCSDALFPSFDIQFPCVMGETRFLDTSTGFPTEWNWNFGDLQFPNENASDQKNPSHQFRFEGEYEITFNAKNNLFDETITRTIQINKYENGLGVPTVNVNGTRLTSSVIAPNYQWYLNDVPLPNANDRILDITNSGVYYVTISDDNCLFKSDPTVVTSLAQDNTTEISLYPNPAYRSFTISIDNGFKGVTRIDVYDMLGSNRLHLSITKTSKIISREIPTSQFPEGLYSVIVRQGNKSSVSKIVIER